MSESDFVHFPDQYNATISETYNGFLAFLPTPSSPDYRSYKGQHFCWFEFKNTRLESHLPLKVLSTPNYLWLLINMRTGLRVKLEADFLIPTDTVLFYQTYIEWHDLALQQGSNWMLLVGIDGKTWPSLSAEYPQLKALSNTQDSLTQHFVHGQMLLHAKLKRILESLLQIQFKPFSTYYQLANWNTRLFQSVFQGMKFEPSAETEDHERQLFHKAVAYIRDNFYDDQLCIASIADALYVSRSKLTRAFHNKQYTIAGLISECRLQEAKKLLRNTDKPVATIAYALNFHCPKNFKRLFIKRFQISPLDYQKSLHIKKLF